MRMPVPRQAIASIKRPQRHRAGCKHRDDIGQRHAAFRRDEIEQSGKDRQSPRLNHSPRTNRCFHIIAIGQRRQSDVGLGRRNQQERQQPVNFGIFSAREHRRREQIERDRGHHRDPQRQQHPIGHHRSGMARIIGQSLGEPALLPQRAELPGQLDNHQRIGKAAERIGAIEPPGDQQKRQSRGQPKQEADEVGPPALGQRSDILMRGFLLFRAHPPAPCSALSGRDSKSATTA